MAVKGRSFRGDKVGKENVYAMNLGGILCMYDGNAEKSKTREIRKVTPKSTSLETIHPKAAV